MPDFWKIHKHISVPVFGCIAYGRKDNYEQAIKDYTKAIELNPDYAVAYYARDYAYHKKGNCQNANGDYQKGCQLGYTTACSYTCK